MKIQISREPIDPWQEVACYPQTVAALKGRFGATAVFVGTMRDFNEGDTVSAMNLEHYPGMTEKSLREIAGAAMARWDLLDVLVVHRVGDLLPNDPIVVVAAWAAHRAAAFDASRFIMEELKSSAPFWKKETLPDRQRWVESNTAG